MVCNILFFLWLIFLGFLFFTADSDVITYEYSTYKRLQESTEKIANKGFVPLFLPEQSNSISVRFNIDTNFCPYFNLRP